LDIFAALAIVAVGGQQIRSYLNSKAAITVKQSVLPCKIEQCKDNGD
jgi:hypothetical protein